MKKGGKIGRVTNEKRSGNVDRDTTKGQKRDDNVEEGSTLREIFLTPLTLSSRTIQRRIFGTIGSKLVGVYFAVVKILSRCRTRNEKSRHFSIRRRIELLTGQVTVVRGRESNAMRIRLWEFMFA